MTNIGTLILLRHGESDWNKKNLFTGWVDVELTDTGREQAKRGGELLVAGVVVARKRPRGRPRKTEVAA